MGFRFPEPTATTEGHAVRPPITPADASVVRRVVIAQERRSTDVAAARRELLPELQRCAKGPGFSMALAEFFLDPVRQALAVKLRTGPIGVEGHLFKLDAAESGGVEPGLKLERQPVVLVLDHLGIG